MNWNQKKRKNEKKKAGKTKYREIGKKKQIKSMSQKISKEVDP